MKRMILLLFVSFLHCGFHARAQSALVFPVNNDLLPKEYAMEVTKIYTTELELNYQQKEKVYNAVYQKKLVQDSLVTNAVHMEGKDLWELYNSLDEQFKQFLTENQYKNYEHLKSSRIYRVTEKQNK